MDLYKDKKILIVDDEEMLREILEFEFKNCGATTWTAPNAKDAFELAKTVQFDVVVTDMRMPGEDGASLLRKISTELEHKPLMYLCTGFSDITDSEAKRIGIKEIFPKPFTWEAIRDKIAEHLK